MSVSVSDYTSLITSEHQGKAKFLATIVASVQPAVDNQNLLSTFPQLFDLDVAVGTQLDAVGAWVGVTRYVSVPLTDVFFTWGQLGLGWGQGVWKGPFTPASGLTTLDDDTFRLLIRARIIANSWDGTISKAMRALSKLFNDSTTPGSLIFIQDHLDMSMTIAIAGVTPSAVFLSLLANGELRLKPVGVRVNYVKSSVSGTPLFGWGVENQYISGWGVGSWAEPLDSATEKGLADDNGVLVLTNASGWSPTAVGLPAGTPWSNGGVVNVQPGIVPNPASPPIYFDEITAPFLLSKNLGNLPWTNPGAGTGKLWNPMGMGEVQVA